MKSDSLIIIGLMLLASTAAMAQGNLDVETTVQKEVVTTNDAGEEVRELVAAETVVPGERVVYTTTFRNDGADPADNIVITNPIDDNLLYVDGSAFGAGFTIEFSADGGTTFAAASDLTVADGEAERQASADDYTHIRWTLDSSLAPGAQGVVRFTAILK